MDMFSELAQGREAQARVIELMNEVGIWQMRCYALVLELEKLKPGITAGELQDFTKRHEERVEGLAADLETAHKVLGQQEEALMHAETIFKVTAVTIEVLTQEIHRLWAKFGGMGDSDAHLGLATQVYTPEVRAAMEFFAKHRGSDKDRAETMEKIARTFAKREDDQ